MILFNTFMGLLQVLMDAFLKILLVVGVFGGGMIGLGALAIVAGRKGRD